MSSRRIASSAGGSAVGRMRRTVQERFSAVLWYAARNRCASPVSMEVTGFGRICCAAGFSALWCCRSPNGSTGRYGASELPACRAQKHFGESLPFFPALSCFSHFLRYNKEAVLGQRLRFSPPKCRISGAQKYSRTTKGRKPYDDYRRLCIAFPQAGRGML